MLLADAVCAAAIATIPALYWTGSLAFPTIVAVAFVVGAFFPAYGSSQSLVLASLVAGDEAKLVRAGGPARSVQRKRQLRRSPPSAAHSSRCLRPASH
jgi:hypothetical protein